MTPEEIERELDARRIDALESCIRDGSYQSIWNEIVAICHASYKAFGSGPALRTAIDGALDHIMYAHLIDASWLARAQSEKGQG